jgi:hypothetical protein
LCVHSVFGILCAHVGKQLLFVVEVIWEMYIIHLHQRCNDLVVDGAKGIFEHKFFNYFDGLHRFVLGRNKKFTGCQIVSGDNIPWLVNLNFPE